MHVLYSALVRGSISAPGQTLDEPRLSVKELIRELLELVASSFVNQSQKQTRLW